MKAKFIGAYFKRIDIFGQVVNFTFNGRGNYSTFCGSILSLLVFFVVLWYANLKFVVLQERGDTSHQAIIETDSIPLDEPFGYD